MGQKRKSFVFLNLTQFFTVINDNIYKLLLIFQLIAIEGAHKSSTILSLAGAIFVLPFLLFAATAGTLSDRYSKRKVIITIRLLEIPIVLLGTLAFYLKNGPLGYSVLFLMSSLSAFFSPSKYGIIPEIVKKEDISHYNGILTATTYLGIILGTFFASFLADLTGKNYFISSFFCLIIALLGAIFSFGIEKTKAQSSHKKVSARFITDTFKTFIRARKTQFLLPVILFGAYFLFLGAYTQLNIIPFSIESLDLTEIEGGYLFLMTAIGIGLGSYFAGIVSGKKVELGLVPLAAFALFILLIGLYFFASHFYVVSALLVMLGIFGGFYIVPTDSFIQAASPDRDRGENLAAANFMNFLGVIIASGLIYLFGNILNLTAAQGFLFVGCLTLVLAIILILLFSAQIKQLFRKMKKQ